MTKFWMNSLLLSLCYLVCTACFAADDYYSQHAIGWHWYDDPKEQVPIKKQAENPAKSDPNIVVEAARKRITTALNRVIAEPTIENLEQYIALQEQLGDRAEKVADLWQQVLLKNPALNYSLSHPTNSVALQVYQEKQSKEKDTSIETFAKQYELFYFYRSTCPYCQRFSPILISFAKRYGVNIIPITMDGISLPEFPNSPRDSGESAQFHVTVTPSVIAVNLRSQKAYPVVYGLTSETELRDNISKIVARADHEA